ncbi:MAG: hypothetical protein M3072_04300 [Candidatus Dormibacteraeota bacterium]|nr:hypothetical protein [Candidatus Dormibacteraeota bacterium]
MAGSERGQAELSPAEAARLLADVRQLPARTRWLAATKFTRLSLVAWGVAWVFGYTAVQVLPQPIGLGAFALLGVGAVTLTRLAAPGDLLTGWEAQFRRGWWVLIGVMPLLGLIVQPTSLATLLLLLGALWGVALLLLAVTVSDRALGAVGGTIVAGAAVIHVLAGGWALVSFGLVGGGAMAVLGSTRLLHPE